MEDIMKRLVLLIALATVFIVNLYCAEKYAVLICGSNPEDEALQPQGQFGGIDRHRFKEFWYDTYLMWEMLRGIGYTEENIFVIFGKTQFQKRKLIFLSHTAINYYFFKD